MQWIINYIRSCFCKHEWELIFDTSVKGQWSWESYNVKVYRCKKCGYSKKYKSF